MKARMIAVGVGYSFNLFNESDVSHIDLWETNTTLNVDGIKYRLHKATTFEDSKKIDRLLDLKGDKNIIDFIKK